MNSWNFRAELLAISHRWYWVVVSFLIGMLLGWGVSFIYPAPYRAIVDVYVGLNAYKSNRDLYVMEVAENEFRNRDDYKNWQMRQLDALALSDEYLAETLTRLQAQDAFWQEMDVPSLREMLTIDWRNTGEWHFAALNGEPNLSAQAAVTWSEVVIEKANFSIAAAERLILLDSRLNALDQALVAAEIRQALLQDMQSVIGNWQAVLLDLPADEPLTTRDHLNLLASVGMIADWTPEWVAILEDQPTLGALPAEYQFWLDRVDAMITSELNSIPSQLSTLQTEQSQVSTDYKLAASNSRALSAGMEVSQIKDQSPEIIHLRPVGTLLLVGGLLGLLIWAVTWLYQITRKTER